MLIKSKGATQKLLYHATSLMESPCHALPCPTRTVTPARTSVVDAESASGNAGGRKSGGRANKGEGGVRAARGVATGRGPARSLVGVAEGVHKCS